MLKFDGKSRVSTENYRKNYDQIFKKKADLAREKEDRQYDNLVHKQELERHLKLDGSGR